MSTADSNNADAEENVELPDDFFDEFEDVKFLDEIVEVIVPEKLPLVRSEDGSNENSRDTSKSNNDEANEDEPVLKRCLDEINNLTKSIERRKRRLRAETSACENRKRKHQSDSPSSSRSFERNTRSRDRRLSPRSPSASRSRRDRSRSRNSRERFRSHDRRLCRRDRSRSETPPKNRHSMSFLEELEQKFADMGQDFPEKQLLMQLRSKENGNLAVNPYSPPSATVGFTPCEPPPMLPYMPSMQMPIPLYGNPVPYPQQWNERFGMVASMQHTIQPYPVLPICATNAPQTLNEIAVTNKDEVIAKCRAACKILRSEENKVPKNKFMFTRTSMPIEPSEEQTFPLQSRKNVEFELTSDKQKSQAPLQFLPPRTRELVKILGFHCSPIFHRLKLKELGENVVNEVDNMDAEKKRTKERSYKETEMQTDTYKCPSCINRESKVFSNKCIQTEAPKKVSIRTQTNEKDYREPLIRSLTCMTAGQLVAVSDFVKLICEPRPSTSKEVYSVREKLMDIYNLSERGPEAIEAERMREEELWHRGINESLANAPVEDLRTQIRGISEHNMGRIPPPPSIHINYQNEIEERENRRHQIRFEENRRLIEMEEQRNRELEWEHQQQQLQRQRDDENARIEMQHDRRKSFNRHPWNNSRGHGRY